MCGERDSGRAGLWVWLHDIAAQATERASSEHTSVALEAKLRSGSHAHLHRHSLLLHTPLCVFGAGGGSVRLLPNPTADKIEISCLTRTLLLTTILFFTNYRYMHGLIFETRVSASSVEVNLQRDS